MKKILSLLIMLCLIASTLTIPAAAKTKTINIGYEDNEITVPFYSKWKLKEDTVGSEETVFDIPGGGQASILILNAADDEDTRIMIKYLSKKKYKNKLINYLADRIGAYSVPREVLEQIFSVKKDGSGKYMLAIDYSNKFFVLKVLDSTHLLVYSTETEDGEVAKSTKKKLISYARKVVLADKEETTPAAELSPDKVVFVSRYSNMAWGYQHRTMLVMGDGRVYSFDYNFSMYPDGDVTEEEIVKLLKDAKKDAVLDKDYLLEMYEHALQVDKNAEFTTEYVMCDYGQDTLYFVKDDGSLVKCACSGDTRYIIKDEHAQKVEKLWDNMIYHCK
jgi:hypothetical protein